MWISNDILAVVVFCECWRRVRALGGWPAAANDEARPIEPFQETFGKPHDLTLPEWRCMMALVTNPGASGEEVAQRMAMDKKAVSRSLRRLERHNRARRESDPANARRNAWQLTEAGWALFDRILPAALERDRINFAEVPADEKARLIRLLRDLEI